MATHTTYSNARANLAAILDRVVADREIVIINRRGGEDVALVAAKELSSLVETAHLLRSPANARRLLKALHRAKSRTLKPQPLEKLRREMRVAEKK
ncbi:MAG TPA: type II toxin-antitoxin system prevent-host-death family antitoxin [Blastocatellia bacterium]|nr:type II toxin-antitoxin system prevent-host-death family antitoxin [Blastocatellia bacterium]